jgi:hypothetical protein
MKTKYLATPMKTDCLVVCTRDIGQRTIHAIFTRNMVVDGCGFLIAKSVNYEAIKRLYLAIDSLIIEHKVPFIECCSLALKQKYKLSTDSDKYRLSVLYLVHDGFFKAYASLF